MVGKVWSEWDQEWKDTPPPRKDSVCLQFTQYDTKSRYRIPDAHIDRSCTLSDVLKFLTGEQKDYFRATSKYTNIMVIATIDGVIWERTLQYGRKPVEVGV